MYKLRRLPIMTMVIFLIGGVVLYYVYDTIFTYQNLEEIIQAPVYFYTTSNGFVWIGLIGMSLLSMYSIYKLLFTGDKPRTKITNALLVCMILSVLLDLSLYYILLFLSNGALHNELKIFVWYNAYSSLVYAFYIALATMVLKLGAVLLSLKATYLDEQPPMNNKTVIIKGAMVLLYGGLIFGTWFVQTKVIAKEITLHLTYDIPFYFSGQNGYGQIRIVYDLDNIVIGGGSDQQLLLRTKSIEEVMKTRYMKEGRIEVISKNNGKLKNGEDIEIQWMKKDEAISNALNITVESKPKKFKIEKLSTQIYNMDMLNDQQAKIVNNKLKEYEESNAFKEELVALKQSDDKDYALDSIKRMAIISEKYDKDDKKIMNSFTVSKERSMTDISGLKKGEARDSYVYEVIFKNNNGEKHYYYAVGELNVNSVDIKKEYNFDNLEVALYDSKISNYPLGFEEILEKFQKQSETGKNLVSLKSIEQSAPATSTVFPVPWDSNQILINGVTIELPVKGLDLEKTGYDLGIEAAYRIDAKKTGPDFYDVIDKNGNKIPIILYNMSDKAAHPKDCYIMTVGINNGLEASMKEIYFPGGFQMGSSIQDVRLVYGKPKSIRINSNTTTMTYESDTSKVTLKFIYGKLNSYELGIKFETGK
ncbi:hypothetical protein M2475_000602 [Breznakia sp. PF5-3]|uniref:hypothetical protein n=1 Tax=unclassified Breznakia TaxID=2623764 RepID=UPI002405A205|nr:MULTISPECIES: hypothetical protein [unclassified Breznakia]MDF9824367.1 hypothetical protein [Breznakia sp. PM6-1]MDF9835042.1 hypothetical protein [Breznakia sp. PF5-3]MDF9837787.1 hypothetical protein [Breznakia sp. PFB2-8]MDF9859666.1 hypothetical protein [Breznakia sp. PH5-24]